MVIDLWDQGRTFMSVEKLKAEIDDNRKKISTDGYKMSIGELNSMYKEKEIVINPDYQRYFRWNDEQKSRLIESILLGIPVPPIFVSQREDGKWEVIDGLQRISTVLQFMGTLLDAESVKYEKLILNKTKLLPSLENIVWEKDTGDTGLFELPADLKLFFKRSSIAIEIIKKESDPNSKYELFQRLNTLGSSLSDQEVRNCLLIMINREMFDWLTRLASNQDFIDSIGLSERNLEQRYEMELVLRLFALKDQTFDSSWLRKEVEEVITESMVSLAEDEVFDFAKAEEKFIKTFKFISQALGDKAFRRFNPTKQRFEGQFLVSAFEAVAIGVYENIEAILATQNYDFESKLKMMWASTEYTQAITHGVKPVSRSKVLVPFGKKQFVP